MSQSILSDKKIFILSIIAAATTIIAGILHLQMAPRSLSQNVGEGVLFLVGGALQLFWAVPVIKQWGRAWQIIGIVGTAVLFALWYADRLHLISTGEMPQGGPQGHQPGQFPRGNMTGGEFPREGGPPRGTGISIGRILPQIEIFQIAFIGLYITLSIMISRKKKEIKQI
ncbi:MAG: hypothetical protein WA833_05605 [Nitrosotalea sp.]